VIILLHDSGASCGYDSSEWLVSIEWSSNIFGEVHQGTID